MNGYHIAPCFPNTGQAESQWCNDGNYAALFPVEEIQRLLMLGRLSSYRQALQNKTFTALVNLLVQMYLLSRIFEATVLAQVVMKTLSSGMYRPMAR